MIQITTGGYRCTIPECDGSKAKVTDFDTSMELFNATVGSCARPVLSNSSNKNKIYLYNCSTIRPEMVNDVVECRSSQDSFLYAPFEFDSTVVTDFNLVCDQVYCNVYALQIMGSAMYIITYNIYTIHY